MRPLTAEQLLVLIRQFFPGSPVLASLDAAAARGAGPRALLALAELLTRGDPKIFMLVARFEIGARELVSTCLDAALSADDEMHVLFEEYCVFGFWGGAASFCPFSVNDHEAMKATWRKIVRRLDASAPDPLLLRPLASATAPRTIAALTVGRLPDGRIVAHLHRHPRITPEMAAGFLRECVLTTMPEADA